MIVIVAEKPDVGTKIAAALDSITLKSGKKISFSQLKSNEKAIKSERRSSGCFKINYLGQECYVTWGFGHLCELYQAYDYNADYKKWSNIPLPFIPDKYKIKIKTGNDEDYNKTIKKQFELVKDLINKADLIFNATDFDREGEVIFTYIYELSGCKKPVKRACFTSQTQKGIQQGFDKAIDSSEMDNVRAAGKARGIADWLVGSNCTVAMTLKNFGNGVYSIGRVQTPTLAMVVDKEISIRSHVSEPYWVIEAEFTTDSGEKFKGKHKAGKYANKADGQKVHRLLLGRPSIVSDIQTKSIKKEVPLLYNQSALQMEANSRFRFTMKKTLDIAQWLYDNGYATYPRTSSQYLTEDMQPVVNEVLDALCNLPQYKKYINGKKRVFDVPHFFDNSKVESHYAIIPTEQVPTSLTDDQRKIYDLICRSVISILYNDAVIEQTKVTIDVNGELFTASGNALKSMGWMAVTGIPKMELLPLLAVGEVVEGDFKLKEKKTEPPKRFTDKTLLAAMLSAGKELDDATLRKLLSDPKTGGIGTEATRASIVETLETRGYIGREKKTIFATEKGIELINKLLIPELKSAELTAKWEQRLIRIADGKESAYDFIRDLENQVREWMEEFKKMSISKSSFGSSSSLLCPVCNKPLRKLSWGWSCTGYKDGCSFRIGEICKKSISDKQVEKLITEGKTSYLEGFVSKKGSHFGAFLVLKDGKIEFEFAK